MAARKSLSVGLQMDPITDVDPDADTTFRFAEAAEARGHRLTYFPPSALRFEEGRVVATAWPVSIDRPERPPARLGAPALLDLASLDVVLLRQDPPFDMHYITTTHLLELIHPKTLVVNDPASVRNAPEKLLVLQFPELTPPTLITRDLEAIRAFRARHGAIIVKPLYGNGGAGVFKLDPGDPNLSALFELFTATSREPLIAQRFLPEVRGGDKRVILIEGEAVGAINRLPAAGEARSNLHVGGRAEPADLSPRDREIAAAIGPTLRRMGLIFAGIDVIGGWLTEINVTSPTGVQELERFSGIPVAERFWEAVEARLG